MAVGGAEYQKAHPEAKRKQQWPYNPQQRWRMPDGTRTSPRLWFEENLIKAVKVIG